MARLVHEGAAVEFPGAAPVAAVVVGLRPGPEHVDVDHVDPAEASLVHGALQQLQRRVTTVLFYDEQADSRDIAGLHHPLAILPARRHRFFGDHMPTGLSDTDGLRGMQAARGGEYDDVRIRALEQRIQAGESLCPGGTNRSGKGRGIDIAHRDKFRVRSVLRDRFDMVARYPAATNQREANLAARNR